MRPTPVVVITAGTDALGSPAFHPANRFARDLLRLMRKTSFDAVDVAMIRDELCFDVVRQNGQPLPFPKDAYRREAEAKPRHVLDHA